ncbi:MAG: hypothetical protein II902_11315, partial [Selenomonadaceae bacterium]|nr:hypothetical protein [Selenomonadaceae bacterium]
SFQDNLLQNEFEQQKEDEENKRNSFVPNGGKIIIKRPDIKPAVAANHAKRVEDATKDGFCLPTLSERIMFIQNREELTYFCKLMNLMVWTNSQENIISACDGIFQASEKD